MVTVEMSESDEFGQSHPVETPEVIKSKLQELQDEILKIKDKEKTAYLQAKEKCPEQIKDDILLGFLRCEVFNADLAAVRLCRYWEKRLELFGPDKAFLPLTLEGMFSDNEDGINLGLATLLPGVKGPAGRSVVLFDPALQDASKYTRAQMVKAFWYIIFSALEDENAAKHGIFFISCTKNVKFSQFDPKLNKMIIGSMQGCLPVRISCIAICYPPTFFRAIWPVIKAIMGSRLRKRIKVMSGSDESVVKQLEAIGLAKEQLPELLGGTLKVDHIAWLKTHKQAGK